MCTQHPKKPLDNAKDMLENIQWVSVAWIEGTFFVPRCSLIRASSQRWPQTIWYVVKKNLEFKSNLVLPKPPLQMRGDVGFRILKYSQIVAATSQPGQIYKQYITRLHSEEHCADLFLLGSDMPSSQLFYLMGDQSIGQISLSADKFSWGDINFISRLSAY